MQGSIPDPWTTREVLVLGSTYPSHSAKYREIACTGAIDCQSLRMVRLHPIPLRYLEEGQRFHKFQLVSMRTRPHDGDGRPETLRVHVESIVPGRVIPAEAPEERRSYLDRSPSLCASVEDLQRRWEQDRTSLGIVRPKELLEVRLRKRPEREVREWMEKERARMAEQLVFGDPPKPLDCVPVTFNVSWKCDDPACKTHDMRLLQWGLHELYRKLASDRDCDAKVTEKMKKELDQNGRDVYFFLGNLRGTECVFGLMDSYSPPKRKQDPDEFQGRLF